MPSATIRIYEGSPYPYHVLLESLKKKYHVRVVFVPPTMKFGMVRKVAMEDCISKYVAMIDDDVILAPNWFTVLMAALQKPDVVAANSQVVYTSPSGLLQKLTENKKRFSGGSGGASIYKRKEILALGNFCPSIHRGEDMELKLRIQAAGKKWVTCQQTKVYHPEPNVLVFLDRPKGNVIGWDYIMKNSKHRFRFMAERFGSTLVMPVYYLWTTGDLRCAGIWAIYKWKSLLYWLSKEYLKWS